MMKFVLALVVLAHASYCQTCKKDVNLNLEMMDRLEELDELYQQGGVNITSPGVLSTVPDSNHACRCQGKFIEKLRALLGNVSLSKKFKDIVTKLKNNLSHLERELKPKHLNVRSCREKPLRNATMVFAKYRTFLERVNSSTEK